MESVVIRESEIADFGAVFIQTDMPMVDSS